MAAATLRRRAAGAGTAIVLAVTALPTQACGTGSADARAERTVVVHAAASLAEVMQDAAGAFARARPGVALRPNLAGSQALATQIEAGAPGAAFVSANEDQVARVADAAATVPVVVATNELVVVVPADDPAGITSLADLADPAAVVVLAAPDVPLGAATREVLERAAVQVDPASLELDARAVLGKVVAGDADAAIVYATDAASSDEVVAIPLPDDVAVTTTYLAVALDGEQRADGEAFVAWLSSDAGRAVLVDHGFGPP